MLFSNDGVQVLQDLPGDIRSIIVGYVMGDVHGLDRMLFQIRCLLGVKCLSDIVLKTHKKIILVALVRGKGVFECGVFAHMSLVSLGRLGCVDRGLYLAQKQWMKRQVRSCEVSQQWNLLDCELDRVESHFALYDGIHRLYRPIFLRVTRGALLSQSCLPPEPSGF